MMERKVAADADHVAAVAVYHPEVGVGQPAGNRRDRDRAGPDRQGVDAGRRIDHQAAILAAARAGRYGASARIRAARPRAVAIER